MRHPWRRASASRAARSTNTGCATRRVAPRPGRRPRPGSKMPTSYVFFFQAEDGIRDYKVTGVQTCALPISGAPVDAQRLIQVEHGPADVIDQAPKAGVLKRRQREEDLVVGQEVAEHEDREIGRASCRERV